MDLNRLRGEAQDRAERPWVMVGGCGCRIVAAGYGLGSSVAGIQHPSRRTGRVALLLRAQQFLQAFFEFTVKQILCRFSYNLSR